MSVPSSIHLFVALVAVPTHPSDFTAPICGRRCVPRFYASCLVCSIATVEGTLERSKQLMFAIFSHTPFHAAEIGKCTALLRRGTAHSLRSSSCSFIRTWGDHVGTQFARNLKISQADSAGPNTLDQFPRPMASVDFQHLLVRGLYYVS